MTNSEAATYFANLPQDEEATIIVLDQNSMTASVAKLYNTYDGDTIDYKNGDTMPIAPHIQIC